jgi:uncharacterized protein YbjT (DUF2867 family)
LTPGSRDLAQDHPVLVIGGTRGTGLQAVRVLQRLGIATRVAARNPTRARRQLGAAVDIVGADLREPDTMSTALWGVRHVILTAGVRSGRFARESVVKKTEYDGVLSTLAAARRQGFAGRLVYMTSIGVKRRSLFTLGLNIWKGNTIAWRRRAEDAIRDSGLDYAIVRAAFLLNRAPNHRAISISQGESLLTFHDCVARADVAEALVESLFHPSASRATFEVKWGVGRRQSASWSALLDGLRPDRDARGD